NKPKNGPKDNETVLDPSPSDRTFYWEWFKHEENLFTNRGSFFLVAEAMLFAAVATMRSAIQNSSGLPLLVFDMLGIFVTIIWLGVNTLHHLRTRAQILTKLNKYEARRSQISGEGPTWLKSHFWIGVILP